METQDKPIPAEVGAESAAQSEAAPAEPSREELVHLVGSLADALDELVNEMTHRRRDPVEAAAQLTIWARAAREQAGAR